MAGLFENFPYTNFHRLNLDWVLAEMKKLVADWADMQTDFSDLDTKFTDLKNYVMNYFANLDVDAEVAAILTAMVNNGDLDPLLNSLINAQVSTAIPSAVTTWLDANCNPVGSAVTVDSSLTIAGSAADSKVVGDSLYKKVDKTVMSLNRFDNNLLTQGYVIYTSGAIANNPNYYASDYIPVVPGTAYRIFDNSSNQQLALYDSSKVYVSGYNSANSFNLAPDSTQIPATAAYIRFTIGTADVNTAGFYTKQEYSYLRHWITNYSAFQYGNLADRVKGEPIKFEVTVNNVISLINEINNIYLTDGFHYTIYLEEGTYTLTAANIATLRDNTYGLSLPDNTDLIGLGAGAVIKLDMTGAAASLQQAYSTLNMKLNNRIENLKLYANNCRYAVHDDNGNSVPNIKQVVKNCEFWHDGNSDGNWAYPAAWGEGTCSGANVEFYNCKFTAANRAFYLHNNTGFDNPSRHLFENCEFIGLDHLSFQLESMGSGCEDLVIFNGCSFKGLFRANANALTPSLTKTDFTVTGSGNSPVCEDGYYNSAFCYISNFGDECISFVNQTGNTIPLGTFMKLSDSGYVPMVPGDSGICFYGITTSEVLDGNRGYIKIRGAVRTIGAVGFSTQGSRVTVTSTPAFMVASAGDPVVGRVFIRDTLWGRQYTLLNV